MVRWLAAPFLVAALAVAALCGDAVVAKSLFDSGKKAFAAKKYDEAVPLFRKAFAEDATLLEAVYWRAQAHEKANDAVSALAAYRDFLDLLGKKSGATAEEQKLKPLAEKRVDALSVADREFQKLEDKYVADLLAVAKAKLASDPAAALAAAMRVLEAQPKNAEALALRDRLGDKKEENPFAGIDTWRDFVKDKTLRSEVVKYAGDLMTIEIKAGGKIRPDPAMTLGTDFGAEMEVRVAEVFDPAWVVGFSIGETKDGYYGVTLENSQVRVLYGKPKARPTIIASLATQPLDRAVWHKLGLVVHGAHIMVYVDGQKVIDESQGERADFSGDVGVTVVGSRAEFRMAKFGAKK
jgi:tetratricopeptide (TPR) repeat protein